MKIVVVGGVAAGMSAAAKAKRTDRSAQVVVFEKGSHVSYGACGLPYYVSGVNEDAELLLIRSPEAFAQQGIELHTGCEVQSVDATAKTVTVREAATGRQWDESYDRLMIGSGAAAIVPPLPGVELPGVHTLKNYQDGLVLQAAVEKAQSVIVVGGGYIGAEMAESLHGKGKTLRVIEAAPRILATFDDEIAEMMLERMRQNGIPVHLEEPLLEILEKDGRAAGVRTDKGRYEADVVILALGIRPATGFLAGSGITLAKNGAVEVDRYQRTSLPDVFAAGDCAMMYDRIQDRNTHQPLGTVANKCGRIAGQNLVAKSEAEMRAFDGGLGSAAILVCGWEAARTGMGEATARELVGEVTTVFIQANDRPQYYPNQTDLWIKLICEKSTKRILGGQAIGEKGAVLRCDAIAAAITGGLSAGDLGMLDFCYAPPFAEAWDALNIAGNAVKD